MPDTNKSKLGDFSIRNPLARILYSSAPLATAVLIELGKLSVDPNAQQFLFSTLSAAGNLTAPFVGVAGNFLAEAISQQFFNRFNRKDILENGDLQKAVGDAIGATILAVYDEQQSIFKRQPTGFFRKLKGYLVGEIVFEAKDITLNKDVLKKLSKVPVETWQKLVEALENDKDDELNLTIEEIQTLYPKNLPDIFAIPAAKFNEVTALDKNVWEKILRKLCVLQNLSTSNEENPHFTDTVAHLAGVLEQNFPELIKHTLVTNIENDGKAYANLQLKIIGEILFYVRETIGKLDETNDKLSDIELKISDLRELLEDGLDVNDREFDREFDEIREFIVSNQAIIVNAIGNLQTSVDRIETTAQKTLAGVDELRRKLDFVEIVPKESFKGFHQSFPRVPNFFTGRKKVLEDLEEKLKTENQASFYGTHGLGKTRTAIEYALRYIKDYAYILFISATKGNFVNNAAFVGAEISAAVRDAQTLESKYNLFVEHLQKHPNWLIIVDNVEDVSEVIGKIPRQFPGNVIYTSNLRDISNAAPRVTIEAMTETEAELTLLRRKLENNDAKTEDISAEEREAITKIVEKIGTLPIGLNLAGAFMNKYQMNFREYLRDYQKFEDATFQNFDLADYYGEKFVKGLNEDEKAEYKGIAGVFLLSYQRIIKPKDDTEREKLISQTLDAILNISVFLAPEKVPEEIWLEGLKLLNENLAEAAKDKLLWLEVRNRLTQAAFFVRNEDENTSSTHRLILIILQKRLKDEEKRRFAEIAVNSANALFPEPKYENWKECSRLQNHAETALSFAENLAIKTQYVARLYNHIAYYIDDLAEYEKAIIFYQKALEINEKIVGKEHIDYAKILNNLGLVYKSQGRYDEAIELYKQAIKINEQTIGRQHPDYATSLNNLGWVYHLQGKSEKAIELYLQVLTIDEKTIGKEHPDYAKHSGNLAAAYQSQGKYDEAIKLYKEGLEINEKTIGQEHPDYAISLDNLGYLYNLQGKYNEAIKFHQKALAIFEIVIGKEHPDYAICLNQLALAYQSAGRYDEAIELHKLGLAIDEKTIGKEHPTYAQRLNNLGVIYHLQGRYDEAIELYKQAIEIDEKTIGREHPDYALRLNSLAIVYYLQDKFGEALSLFEESLRILENTLSENHPYIQTTRKILELCRQAAGKR